MRVLVELEIVSIRGLEPSPESVDRSKSTGSAKDRRAKAVADAPEWVKTGKTGPFVKEKNQVV